MSEFWQELIKSLGGLAIFAASLAWLTRSIVVHFLSKDVEAYKSRIASEAARDIEQFKAQLQRMAREHDVRFSNLHERRAKVISDLYALLQEANSSTELMNFVFQLTPLVGEEDQFNKEAAEASRNKVAEEIADKCSKLSSFFSKHKLYFSEELSERTEKLISAISEPSSNYHVRRQLGVGEPQELSLELLESLRNEHSNIQLILKLLEKDFRTLLGSDYESNTLYPIVDREVKARKNRKHLTERVKT